jgi:LmbE family N-acetylglucosaminyl deacetylase
MSKDKDKKSLPVFAPREDLRRVLVVAAHPDDIDYGCAGTVATLTALGIEVQYCLVTSGDAGGDDSTATREERALVRESEQTAAAHEVGVTTLHFLRFADGEVEPTLKVRREISRVIRIAKPDVVICQSPERNWERIYASHPDHLAAGEATMRAVYPDSRNPHSHRDLLAEGFAPHTVPEVWVMSTAPTMVVDITENFERKVAALSCHVSQLGPDANPAEFLTGWNRLTAKQAGLDKGRLAEGFKVVATR